MAEEEVRRSMLRDLFSTLDKKRRGFLSRIELVHILDAMHQDPHCDIQIPDELQMGGAAKDTRVQFDQLEAYFGDWSTTALEDLKWFAESVVRVERELRNVWQKAVHRWREKVSALYERDLHRYVLSSQPERVARWLLLRTSTSDEAATGLLGLGISAQEVEVLFTNDTSADIDRCSELVEPFLLCLRLRDKLWRFVMEEVEGGPDEPPEVFPDLEARILDCLQALNNLASDSRYLSCLLIHEGILQLVTSMMKARCFAQSVGSDVSTLVLTLVSWGIHTSDVDYERHVARLASDYLEVDFEVGSFELEVERLQVHETQARSTTPRRVVDERPMTVSDWVACLLTLTSDFDRGEMLDQLIKYDERRLSEDEDSGAFAGEVLDFPSKPQAAAQKSLFASGRVIPYLLIRLDVSSHHTIHEHRTPLRTHMLKLLLNILMGAEERGRELFRAGNGMQVLCILIRGNAWGIEREEMSVEEEDDRDEEDSLYMTQQWIWQDPYQSWPYIESETSMKEQRYYQMDFLDDKFYGSKDRLLAVAVLEHLSTDEMWGKEYLVDELMSYPYTLQVLCRVRPPCYFLINLLLTSNKVHDYLKGVCMSVAAVYAQQAINPVYKPDATCHSIFPLLYSTQLTDRGESALSSFRECVVEVESRNVYLRVLAHAHHNFLNHLQEERANRESTGGGMQVLEEENEEATQLEEDITETCKLLAHLLPLSIREVVEICVAMYQQIEAFTRKALLAVNQLPPVNPDEKQKARSLEVAKTVPPRPMYFGHYQMLIYNQSNPTQPSTRTLLSDRQAQLKCLQGAADILFTGENRYLSEPSLLPNEFLICVRLVQLVRLKMQVPPFVQELQDLLEQLTGYRSSFTFTDAEDDIELAGAEYPWRTGLAPLNTFRVSQVPVRASNMRQFRRDSPLAVAAGILRLLEEYEQLDLWEDDGQEETQRHVDKEKLDVVAHRRHVILALVFNLLAYYHPKAVTLEDSPQGLAMRMGMSVELCTEVIGVLEDLQWPLESSGELPEGVRLVSHSASIRILFVTVEETDVAFVELKDVWMLWANSSKDNANVLTETSNVDKYFNFAD